jgi:hypothetical protein
MKTPSASLSVVQHRLNPTEPIRPSARSMRSWPPTIAEHPWSAAHLGPRWKAQSGRAADGSWSHRVGRSHFRLAALSWPGRPTSHDGFFAGKVMSPAHGSLPGSSSRMILLRDIPISRRAREVGFMPKALVWRCKGDTDRAQLIRSCGECVCAVGEFRGAGEMQPERGQLAVDEPHDR